MLLVFRQRLAKHEYDIPVYEELDMMPIRISTYSTRAFVQCLSANKVQVTCNVP